VPSRHANPAASTGQGSAPPKTTAELSAENAALRDRLAALERLPAGGQPTADGPAQDAKRFVALFHLMADAFCLLDAQGRFLDVNEAYCRTTGYSREELLEMGVRDVEVPLTLEETVSPIQDRVRAGSTRFETRHRRKDGGTVDLEVSMNLIPEDGGRVVLFAREVTLRKQADRALLERTRQLEAVRAISEEAARCTEVERAQAEALLREREAQYRHILETAAEGIWVVDAEHRTTFANQKIAEMLGYTVDEMIGRCLSDFVDEEDRHKADAAMARRRQGVAEQFERSFRRKDGSRLLAHVSASPIYDETGKYTGSLGMLTDITERKKVEEVLCARTQQLEAIRAVTTEITRELELARLLDLILRRAMELVGASTGVIRLWDDSTRMLVPVATQDEGRLLWPLRLGEGVSGIAAQRRRGMIVNDFRTSPYATPRHLQQTTFTAILAEPLLYRERLVGVIAVGHKAAQGSFRPEEADLLRLFATQAAIAIENARLHEAANRRAERLANLNALTRTLTTTTDPEQVAQQILAALEILIPGSVARLWLRDAAQPDHWRLIASAGLRDPAAAQALLVRPTDGLVGLAVITREAVTSPDLMTDPRFINQSWAEAEGLRSSAMLPLVFGDQAHGVLAVSTRVRHEFDGEEVELLRSFAAQAAIALENARLFAELKRAYEDLSRAQDGLIRSEKLRALGQMAAGIAHDLNNILAAILGQTDLLRLRAAGLPVHEALNTLELAATDAAEVVRRLQEFSRQQASRPLAPVDLATIVREVLEITKPRWKDEPQARGVVIEARLALADLPPVLGHAPEIREALTNLILNAVDAMPRGGTLTITAHEVTEAGGPAPKRSHATTSDAPGAALDGHVVEVTVTDTGVGMTAEVRQRVFDPFFTTKGVKGSGLGLSVVYGIMQRHGGQIEATSSPGQGTTFALRFMVAVGAVEEPSQSIGCHAIRPRRILLIDDDPTVRRTMADLLQEVGHSVVVAEGGVEGLAHLGQSRVDLVITDLGMPGMTGWEVARAVKLVTSHPPVVLLTGWGERPASHSEHAGLVDRILGKPVRLDELLATIRDLTRPADEPGDVSL
jgi:PAS domain S-box-containing protein